MLHRLNSVVLNRVAIVAAMIAAMLFAEFAVAQARLPWDKPIETSREVMDRLIGKMLLAINACDLDKYAALRQEFEDPKTGLYNYNKSAPEYPKPCSPKSTTAEPVKNTTAEPVTLNNVGVGVKPKQKFPVPSSSSQSVEPSPTPVATKAYPCLTPEAKGELDQLRREILNIEILLQQLADADEKILREEPNPILRAMYRDEGALQTKHQNGRLEERKKRRDALFALPFCPPEPASASASPVTETPKPVAKVSTTDKPPGEKPAHGTSTSKKTADQKSHRKHAKHTGAPTDADHPVPAHSKSGTSPETARAIGTIIDIGVGVGLSRVGRHGGGDRRDEVERRTPRSVPRD